MTTGPYTHYWLKQEEVKTVEVQNWVIDEPSGLPQSFVLHTRDSQYIYAWPYQFGKSAKIKMGFSFQRNIERIAKVMQDFVPSKLAQTSLSIPCFRVNRVGYDDFQAFRRNGAIWYYGFTGQGFKHGPSIGEDVRKLVEEKWPRPKL